MENNTVLTFPLSIHLLKLVVHQIPIIVYWQNTLTYISIEFLDGSNSIGFNMYTYMFAIVSR